MFHLLFKYSSLTCSKHITNTRNFWQWLNIIFNSVDEERCKLYGPDRCCAEWLLRNGASVKWTHSGTFLSDYNKLPPENIRQYIQEVDATDSSISHYGFPHFAGCKYINKMILHKCGYLENEALPLLKPLKDTLKHLQISSCGNITEVGLNSLVELINLETLIIANLPDVKDKDAISKTLTASLKKCNIQII